MNNRIFALLIFFLPVALSGQILLKDIDNFVPGASSGPGNWSAISDDLFIFEATNTLQTQYLFASDGTEAGTIGLGGYLLDTDMIRLGNKAYFGGCNILFSADSCTSLYVSDGTVAGTSFFFDLDPGGLSLGIEDIVAGDSLFYFSGHTINEGYELWRSNGTAAGTYRIMDIAPGATSGYAGELAVIDDIAYFAGYTDAAGVEAWRSDGTIAGTYMIDDLNVGTGNGNPAWFTASGGYVYFSALGTDTGVELRRTNGTQGNVELIGEFGGTTDSSWPEHLTDSDGTLYYAAVGLGSAGHDLYVYDHVGDPLHIDFNIIGDIFPRALMPFGNGEIIFTAKTSASGRELWHSDGTQAGTKMITDLYPGEKDGVYPIGFPQESFYVWKDSLVYFSGADSVHATDEFVYELFVSDGTEAGTKLVSDHVPGAAGSNPGDFFEHGNRLYFAMSDLTIGREPYFLDFGNVNGIFEPKEGLTISQLPFPNPLPKGQALNVEINLPSGSEISTQVFDLQGRLVQEETNVGYFPAGNHVIKIKTGNQPAGFYYLVLRTGDGSQTQKFVME